MKDMNFMFRWCEKFNQDINGWNVENVKYIFSIFDECNIQEEYKPKFNIGD